MKKKIRYTYFLFAVSFIVTIIIAILYLEEFSRLQTSNKWVEHTYEVKNQILKVESGLIDAENIQRGYLITHNSPLLSQLRAVNKNILNETDSLKTLTADNPGQQKIIAKLRTTISSRFIILYQTIDAANINHKEVFEQNAEKGRMIMKDFLSLSNEMDEAETALLGQRKRTSNLLEIATSLYLKLILIISILFQIVSFIIILKALKRTERYQKILEHKINELNLSNSELEQMAFVASHDLQEPLRKIRTYSDRLIKKNKNDLNDEVRQNIDKMVNASVRMQDLLSDLINYTKILKSNEELSRVNLTDCLNNVIAEFKSALDKKKAIITTVDLPAINGNRFQLHTLFSSLLDNALKFAKPGIAPQIRINALETQSKRNDETEEYVRISFSDNGIGFDKEFNEKIFMIFQRLHSQHSSYSGKGIGLAICKKVMMNHGGYITAISEAGEGATFHLYFPKNRQSESA